MKKLTIATLLLTLLTVPISAQPKGDCSKGKSLKCYISKLPRPVKIVIIKVAK